MVETTRLHFEQGSMLPKGLTSRLETQSLRLLVLERLWQQEEDLADAALAGHPSCRFAVGLQVRGRWTSRHP